MGNDFANFYRELHKDNQGQAQAKLVSAIAEAIEILGTQATLDIVAEQLELEIE